jgi:hypothetical protein
MQAQFGSYVARAVEQQFWEGANGQKEKVRRSHHHRRAGSLLTQSDK